MARALSRHVREHGKSASIPLWNSPSAPANRPRSLRDRRQNAGEIAPTNRPSPIPSRLTRPEPAAPPYCLLPTTDCPAPYGCVSSFAFTFGLVALAAFALGLASHLKSAPALVAGAFIGLGALLDAAGTPAPLVALNTDPAIGQAFLRYTLILDATFNGCLGVGLIAAFFAQTSKLRWLALASGVLSLPVAFQWMSADAAKLLMIAGPAWLGWITATSIELLRTEQ